MAGSYWCHACSETVNPIPVTEAEMKCPFCQSGFVGEMSSSGIDSNENQNRIEADLGSERTRALWAPILLGRTDNPKLGRRRRNPAFILQLHHGIRAGLAYDNDSNSASASDSDERERVTMINPFNNQSQTINGSVADYLIRHGLELSLQHLAENDPNRYGTPAQEAIEPLPSVTISKTLQCCVCLDDLEVGSTAKEMPRKHRFHGACILPWLQLHSSCPVCRSHLPVHHESKPHSIMSLSTNDSGNPWENEADAVSAAPRFSSTSYADRYNATESQDN